MVCYEKESTYKVVTEMTTIFYFLGSIGFIILFSSST